jgi:DNA replication protein DnaC
MAPETLQQAKTQRWAPEELLRTFVEAEIAARDAANLRQRRTAAGFPVPKTLDQFKVQASSVPQATFDYLATLEWVRAAENLCLVGPPGTGKSHLLVALGHAAVRPATGCVTRLPPSWSRPSIKGWRTTRSGGCSTGCCATTW